jgi:hypothetical protein
MYIVYVMGSEFCPLMDLFQTKLFSRLADERAKAGLLKSYRCKPGKTPKGYPDIFPQSVK